MIQFTYLAALLIGITGIAVIDWRYRLAFWANRRRTLTTLLITIGIFIVWDVLGIMLGIFFHGDSRFALPFRILPEFPIEELFFLFLLTYVALLIYRFVEKRSA